MVRYIEQFYANLKVTLIYGAMRDKAVVEMTGILFPAADIVIATAPAQERSTRPETIRELERLVECLDCSHGRRRICAQLPAPTSYL